MASSRELLPRDTEYADFEATGWQDCANAISASDFYNQKGTPAEVVDRVFARYESEGLREEWLQQNREDFDKLDPAKCYERWRSGWKQCARGYVTEWQKERARDEADEADVSAARDRRGNPRTAMRNPPNPMISRFVVVRVDQDDRRTHAVKHGGDVDAAIARAIAAARPGRNALLDYGIADTADAKPRRWIRLSTERTRNPAMADYILEGMARAIWVTSYADWVHGLPPAMRRELGPNGGDWDDVAPTTPASAEAAAKSLADRFEMQNGVTMDELATRAAAADGQRARPVAWMESLGHYLAMQALGTGVSWFDDHGRFPLEVPRLEAWCSDGEDVEWSPRSNPGGKLAKPPAASTDTKVELPGGYKVTLRPAQVKIEYSRGHGHGGGVQVLTTLRKADDAWLVLDARGMWVGALMKGDDDYTFCRARAPHSGTRRELELASHLAASGLDWKTVLAEGL